MVSSGAADPLSSSPSAFLQRSGSSTCPARLRPPRGDFELQGYVRGRRGAAEKPRPVRVGLVQNRTLLPADTHLW